MSTLSAEPRKDPGLIYDVGMHKGEDTEFYLKKGFRVVAFEANPELVVHCKERFTKEIEDGRLRIVEGAIIDMSAQHARANTIRFHRNLDNSVWGTVNSDWASRNEKFNTSSEVIEVPAIDFRQCLLEFGVPYYLKIDIEGLDTVCLKALIGLREKPDHVSIESEKVSFDRLKAEFDLFKELGYTEFTAVNQADIALQREPADTTEGQRTDHRISFGSSGLFGTDLRGTWFSRGAMLRRYRLIYLGYRFFGDLGSLRKYKWSKKVQARLGRWFGTQVPGWYDTHARRSSGS